MPEGVLQKQKAIRVQPGSVAPMYHEPKRHLLEPDHGLLLYEELGLLAEPGRRL